MIHESELFIIGDSTNVRCVPVRYSVSRSAIANATLSLVASYDTMLGVDLRSYRNERLGRDVSTEGVFAGRSKAWLLSWRAISLEECEYGRV